MYHLITQEFINDCNGYIDIMRKLGLKVKPGRVPKIHNQIELFNLDITHFNNDNRRSRYDVARFVAYAINHFIHANKVSIQGGAVHFLVRKSIT